MTHEQTLKLIDSVDKLAEVAQDLAHRVHILEQKMAILEDLVRNVARLKP